MRTHQFVKIEREAARPPAPVPHEPLGRIAQLSAIEKAMRERAALADRRMPGLWRP